MLNTFQAGAKSWPAARQPWSELIKQVVAVGIVASVAPSVLFVLLNLAAPSLAEAVAAWLADHVSLFCGVGDCSAPFNSQSWLTSVKAAFSLSLAGLTLLFLVVQRYSRR